jgi:hypothetical protein
MILREKMVHFGSHKSISKILKYPLLRFFVKKKPCLFCQRGGEYWSEYVDLGKGGSCSDTTTFDSLI